MEHDLVHCQGVLTPISLSRVAAGHRRVCVAQPVLHTHLSSARKTWATAEAAVDRVYGHHGEIRHAIEPVQSRVENHIQVDV